QGRRCCRVKKLAPVEVHGFCTLCSLEFAVYVEERDRYHDGPAVGAEIGILGLGELGEEAAHLLNGERVAGFYGHFARIGDCDMLALDDQPAGDGLVRQFIYHVLEQRFYIFTPREGGYRPHKERITSER